MNTWKLVLVVGCLLGIGWSADFAQAEVCECICIADSTCEEYTGCRDKMHDGSVRKLFTANCDGVYGLAYELSCEGEACAHCFACVSLRDVRGSVIAVSHSTCQGGDCSGSNPGTAKLIAGQQYELCVGLQACDGHQCKENGGCIARGYLYKNARDCASVICP